MIGLALLPLAGYLFLLAAFQLRSRPTVLSGDQDFLLLSCGLFGLLTLGPSRLLIPMDVLAFWHVGSWVFWTLFYFATVYLLTRLRMCQKIVIYHCPMSVFIPKLLELCRELDPGARLEGNVLFLKGLGIQCLIDGDVGGGHIELREIGGFPDRLRWRIFERGVRSFSRTLPVPPPGNALLFLLAGGIFALGGVLFFDVTELLEEFAVW